MIVRKGLGKQNAAGRKPTFNKYLLKECTLHLNIMCAVNEFEYWSKEIDVIERGVSNCYEKKLKENWSVDKM